ncbi:MAG: hypothetical protein ABJN95_18405 [Maribacter sp.]|uniref:hypothetical protein n=1 Tax=Maribacter sp. TaxID=1897614 RepID=UPI0032992638
MEIKTSDSYRKEVLAKYRKEKGGEMSSYLTKPTRKQIRQACLWLFDKRNSNHDQHTLKRFFQLRTEEDGMLKIQKFDADRFIPVVNFLKGNTNSTSIENLELISWLIDFQPRPLQEYLKFKDSISEEDELDPKKETERKKQEEEEEEKRRRSKRILIVSISISFAALLLILIGFKYPMSFNGKPSECMTWADSLYVQVSCDSGPFSLYGTKVDTLDQMKLKKMRKVEVDVAYKFFSDTGEPLIWYYKKSIKEIEYYTAPGLHPTNGETLRKITPYIIETYVPIHFNKENSFIKQ